MKKYVITLILIISILFSGCADEPQNIKEKIEIKLTPYDMPKEQTKWVTLYYPNAELNEILAFSQPVTATENIYDEIMKALLSGTSEGYVSPFPEGISCRNIMLLNNILYIDMSWQFNEMSAERFLACVSVLTTTYTGLSEISFVNITVEGKQINLPEKPEHPIMLLSQYTGTLQALQNHYLRHNEVLSIETFYGAIYVGDETGKYIVPQVKNITVREGKYASALVSQLLAESTAIFPSGFMLSGEPSYDGKNGTVYIELICPQQWNYDVEWLGPYALVSTLDTLYPEVNNLILTVKDAQGIEKAKIDGTVTDYFSKIRSVVEVFAPDMEGTNIVRTNMLVSSVPGSGDLKAFIKEYLVMINSEFRTSENLVRGVAIKDNTVIINLSADFFNYYSDIIDSREKEYALIYSLISVACTYTGTAKALLLEDSKTRTTVAGFIKTDKPLLKLPMEYTNTIQ